eukprot:13610835-Ditylum_brightwellii.AAC.1
MKQARKTYLARVLVKTTTTTTTSDNDGGGNGSIGDDTSIPLKFPYVIDIPLGFDKQTCLAFAAISTNKDNDDEKERGIRQ